MKTFVYLIIALVAVSCLKNGDSAYYILTSGRVEITQADLPETATVNQFAEIKVRAEESNDCWSNLNFKLTKNNSFDYTLEAFGVFESFGSCLELKVTGDTTIAFKPTQTGVYKFHIIKNETETVLDSISVVGDI